MEKERKDKTAVALAYEPSNEAPVIVATGKGYLAEKILKKAKEEHVPVHKDEKLAGALGKLELGDQIPPELYDVVAEILVFVGNMESLRSKLNGKL